MRKLIYIFLVCQFLTSCKTVENYCNTHYPATIKDSIWEVKEYVCEHDTVPIPLRSINWDTTYDFSQSVVLHIEKKQNGLTSILNIKNGKINVLCEADSLRMVIEQMREKDSNFELKTATKYLPCEKKHHSSWDTFCNWHTVISWILVFICVVGYCWIKAFK